MEMFKDKEEEGRWRGAAEEHNKASGAGGKRLERLKREGKGNNKR